MKPKIVCLDGATVYEKDSEMWDGMRLAGEFVYYERTAPEEIVGRCRGAQIVLTNKVPMTAATIAALPELKYIGVLATGYNIVDTEAAKRAGVTVTNIPAYSTMSVAQHVFSLLFAAVTHVEAYAADVARGGWSTCPDFSYRLSDWHELSGKTFGIVGYGNIGSRVAAIASALGMKVALFTSKPQERLPEGYVKMELDELFGLSDVLSLHCPLTPATKGIADARRLALMKPTAILINTARGPLVDEGALAAALREGKLGAACCDVLMEEPPRSGSPLTGAPRCFVTPHIAWASAEARERLAGIATANVEAFVGGNAVNTVG